jgi:hypothetical protein
LNKKGPNVPKENVFDYNDAMLEAAIDQAVAAERERCANLVPTNWCDALLTGKDAPKHPLDNRGVEALLRGIQDRIRNSQ